MAVYSLGDHGANLLHGHAPWYPRWLSSMAELLAGVRMCVQKGVSLEGPACHRDDGTFRLGRFHNGHGRKAHPGALFRVIQADADAHYRRLVDDLRHPDGQVVPGQRM